MMKISTHRNGASPSHFLNKPIILSTYEFVLLTGHPGVSVEGCEEVRKSTYAEVRANVSKLAASMKQMGVKSGDRVVGEGLVFLS